MQISVIVPLYNKAATIQRAIRSIQSQTMEDFELLIVDDGSTDESVHRVREVLDARGRIISQKNAGPGAARNRGVREAQGDYVAFLDGDDEWLPNYLSESFLALEQHTPTAQLTVAGYIQYPEQISREGMWRSRGLADGLFTISNLTRAKEVLPLLAYLSPCTTIMSRELFLQCGGFYEQGCRYGEDAYLMLRALLRTSIHIRLTPLVIYHREDSNLSANLSTVRPIEPFLQNPTEFLDGCPQEWRELASQVLTLRAYKTACVLGYWGESAKARKVLIPFLSSVPLISPLLFPALISTTPIADALAWLIQKFHYCRGCMLR